MTSGEDIDQLKLLSIFHYVVAGICALFAMLPIMHLAFGIAILSGAMDNVDKRNAPPEILGWMMVIFAALFILGGLLMATGIAFAGRRLRQHRGYTYCLVVAGILCIFMPLGTILGVFTIIVLVRPSVKKLFGVADTAEPHGLS